MNELSKNPNLSFGPLKIWKILVIFFNLFDRFLISVFNLDFFEFLKFFSNIHALKHLLFIRTEFKVAFSLAFSKFLTNFLGFWVAHRQACNVLRHNKIINLYFYF